VLTCSRRGNRRCLASLALMLIVTLHPKLYDNTVPRRYE
jgi:hypothetical protein